MESDISQWPSLLKYFLRGLEITRTLLEIRSVNLVLLSFARPTLADTNPSAEKATLAK